jgi:hypothetical protein
MVPVLTEGELKELVISNQTDLIQALSARRRYLEYGITDDGSETIGFTVVEEQDGEPVIVARVDEQVARAWIEDGHGQGTPFYGPYRSTFNLPEFSGFRDLVDCGEDFVKGDTVQWRESAFDRNGGGTPKHIGTLEVVAKVVREDRHGWVRLQVLECEVIADKSENGRLQPLRIGREIKRARKTVGRRAQRVRWADEAARAKLVAAMRNGG